MSDNSLVENINNENLYINENGVVSLEDEREKDIDYSRKLFIKTTNNLKLEIKYPNLDRSKPLNDSVASLIGTPATTNRFNYFNKFLKHVHVKVKPKQAKNDTNKSFCESVLGIYPNLAFDSISNDYKIVIQGLIPKGALSKHQTLKIGDLIMSINDIEVNSANIEALLSAIRVPQTIKISALSPLTYVNLNTSEIVSKKLNLDSRLSKRLSTIMAPSKSTTVVKGDRIKLAANQLNEDVFYLILMLSLDKDKVKRKENSDEKVSWSVCLVLN